MGSEHERIGRFVRAAEIAAERLSTDTCRAFLTGDMSVGFWHPNGFATYRVELIDQLGLARLHIWPRNLRRSLLGHPEIHCHRFDLHAKVLAGTYVESRYTTRPGSRLDGLATDCWYLSRYDVRPPERQAHDRIVETSTHCLVSREVHSERYVKNEYHSLAAGEFHSTEIPSDDFCATLAILSTPLVGQQDVLFGPPGFGSLSSVRPRVLDGELEIMRAQMDEILHSSRPQP